MGKYIKKFNTYSEYNIYINGQNVILPNVSYCEDQKGVHYNPWVAPPFFCKLTLQNNSVIEIEGSGELTQAMVSNVYKTTLVSAEIGNLCTSIGQSAFYQCSKLTSVTIPSSVTSIGDWSFCDAKLTSVTIPSSVTSIGQSAFVGCSFTSVIIPDSVTSIGYAVFGNCSSLTSVTIGSGLTTITGNAFSNCTSLTNIIIPNTITKIEGSAFGSCSALTSITIPSSVINIGNYAFQNCTSLTSATFEATTPSTGGSSIFFYASNCPIYVPAASVDTYKAASGWSEYASRIQAIPTT